MNDPSMLTVRSQSVTFIARVVSIISQMHVGILSISSYIFTMHVFHLLTSDIRNRGRIKQTEQE